jgi:hypothetical protein
LTVADVSSPWLSNVEVLGLWLSNAERKRMTKGFVAFVLRLRLIQQVSPADIFFASLALSVSLIARPAEA